MKLILALFLVCGMPFAQAADVKVFRNPSVGGIGLLASSNKDGVCIALGYTDYVRGTATTEEAYKRPSIDYGMPDETSYRNRWGAGIKLNRKGKRVGHPRVGGLIAAIQCMR